MKVLFISSGNSFSEISPIIKSQAYSLIKEGVHIDFYEIKGRGIIGYLNNIKPLRIFQKKSTYDIIHAHYGLSAIIATLSGASPLIVSLMGSDVMEGGWQLRLIRWFVRKKWGMTIVKSNELAKIIGEKHCVVIPNGVDINKFVPLNKYESKQMLNLDQELKYILFLANPIRYEKNFQLVKTSFDLIKNSKLKLICLHNTDHEEVPYYLNSSEAVILSSLWEGSPNVIKEAMACNIPIVYTDVGDVRWLIGDAKGCYSSSFNPEDMAKKIKMALDFGKRTNGRQRIIELGLDSETVAKRIIDLYKKVLRNHKYKVQ